MTSFPPTIRNTPGQPISRDPAKYLISRNNFVRPSLRVAPNGPLFEWPMGTEGIRVSGQAGLAQHMYLGDNAPVVQVVHRDSRRIEMRGQFMGFTGSQNMRDLIEVITASIPQGFWLLRLPAVIFPKEQAVVVESYDFDHSEEDRTETWDYAISMVRTGVGTVVQDSTSFQSFELGNTQGNENNPSVAVGAAKGEAGTTFTTRAGGDTLRLISAIVYGDPNQWKIIYEKNQTFFNSQKTPLAQLQYVVLQPGLKLNV